MDAIDSSKGNKKINEKLRIILFKVKKNKKHILVVSLLLIVYLATIAFILHNDILNRSGDVVLLENGTGDVPVGEIVENDEVVQTFVANEDIKAISLNLATYARVNTGVLKVKVINENTGEQFLDAVTNLEELEDNTFRTYYLNKVLEKTNDTLKIILTTEGTYQGNAPTVWSTGEDSYPEGELTVNGAVKTGDLAFKLIGNSNDSEFITYFYIVLAVFILALLLSAYYIIFIRRSKIEKVYITTAMLIGTLYMILLQPGTIPDESRHIDTAYTYSNVIMLKGFKTDNGGILKRKDDVTNWYLVTKPSMDTFKELFAHMKLIAENTELVEVSNNFIKTAPYLYLPSSLGITLARILRLGTVPLFYLGRLFNFMFFTFMTYIAIKKIPFGKIILFVVSLYPITMQQAVSFSYDAVINGLAFCFIGYCLNVAYCEKMPTKKDLVMLCLVGVFLAPAKYIYVGICLLLLLIPKEKFQSRKNKAIYLAVFAISAVALFLASNLLNIINRLAVQVSGIEDIPPYSFDYILKNPLGTLKLIVNTICVKGDFYIAGAIGLLGWFNITLPWVIILGYIILFIFSCWRMKDERQYISTSSKLLITFVIISVFILALLSMMLIWTPNTYPYIEGVQGRYFIPIIPLVGLLCRNSSIVLNKNIDRLIMFSCIILQTYSMLNIFTIISHLII